MAGHASWALGLEMARERIFLVGFMGSGKSTVGPLVAEKLGWDFVDLDQEIEREQGKAIREIFDDAGEPEFRKIETRHLQAMKDRSGCVIALGGGAFAQEANRPIVAELGVSVFLDCRLEVILARCPADGTRPLLQTPERVKELYTARSPLYRKSDFSIDVSDLGPAQAAASILKKVTFER
ncbi:MAG: shikimate kinase [Acidobacteria bacterium]|nr:shikimate kinase [Acidobacteriota bacterium]